MDKVKEALNNLKNKKIRFSKTPEKKTKGPVTSANVKVEDESFVDLHMKVAERVDVLIDKMDHQEEVNKKTVFRI